jgi:hypothetical protein
MTPRFSCRYRRSWSAPRPNAARSRRSASSRGPRDIAASLFVVLASLWVTSGFRLSFSLRLYAPKWMYMHICQRTNDDGVRCGREKRVTIVAGFPMLKSCRNKAGAPPVRTEIERRAMAQICLELRRPTSRIAYRGGTGELRRAHGVTCHLEIWPLPDF